MLVDLPLVMTNGLFKNLDELNEDQITAFLRYLVNFEAEKFQASIPSVPSWWGDEVLYPQGFHLGRIPIPYTRRKLDKLRSIVKNCYASHNCEDLLELSAKLAKLHVLEYQVIRNADNSVTISQKDSNSPMVVIPASNLDYDYRASDPKFGNVREVTICPVKKAKVDLSPVTIELTDSDDDDCTVVIADSSSDDEVQIVSYTPPIKRLKPISPKKRLHSLNCPLRQKSQPVVTGSSRHFVNPRFVQDRSVSQVINRALERDKVVNLVKPPVITVDLLKSKAVPNPRASEVRKPGVREILAGNVAYYHNPSKKLPGPLKNEPPLNPRRRLLSFTRRFKPKEFVDLTFDEEEPIKIEGETLQELPQNDVLAVLNLAPSGAPPKIEPRPVERRLLKQPNLSKKLRVNMQKIEICQVNRLVSLGLLPKNCLYSAVESQKQLENIERFTRTDLTFHVDLSDTASVARTIRKCSVPLVRLNSAAVRKWRKPLNPL
ncbi:NLS-Hypothetical protein and DNA-Hypothetical protein and dimerisation domains of Nrf1 [Nesidiocoris tenuis]|uniref:Nuclear respiratory factor 1 NLS/DNA-binding dimerisation domain-containing protein n=1 Tax=Nesidiocoris tenuis TaxID=355587 RepID=A0ABN7BDA9_9HEMI|nr:NLS-Hypothetical protein and DNA-Hypothetical protein and dimerisation domains of Nrf1 [Nesidiocoris tenuis]